MEAQDVQAQPTGMIKEVEWNAQDTNFVAMIGHLGSDPELRQFPSGACKASLNLAVNRKVKDKEKETYWMSVEAWGDLAQECQQVLRKGQQVRVLGQVANATWTDAQTQQERRRMFIRARAIDRIAPYQAGNSYASAGTPQQSYDYATGETSQQGSYQQAGEQSYQQVGEQSYQQPQQAAPSYSQPAPYQSGESEEAKFARKQDENARRPQMWVQLDQDPSQFWDNREKKTNQKAPDFKHKDTGFALWVSSAPGWYIDKHNLTA